MVRIEKDSEKIDILNMLYASQIFFFWSSIDVSCNYEVQNLHIVVFQLSITYPICNNQ